MAHIGSRPRDPEPGEAPARGGRVGSGGAQGGDCQGEFSALLDYGRERSSRRWHRRDRRDEGGGCGSMRRSTMGAIGPRVAGWPVPPSEAVTGVGRPHDVTYQIGQAHRVLEIGGGVFTGGDVAGQRAIHRRHIDRSGRQRVGRLVNPFTLTVETEGEPTRLEAVWVTAGQQESPSVPTTSKVNGVSGARSPATSTARAQPLLMRACTSR